MALKMAQPWKHPKTGMFYLRRGVPNDLWRVLGKREEKKSLGTKDRDLAKQRFIVELAQCEARWAALRGHTKRLTEQEAHVIAQCVHDEWLLQHGLNPTLDYWDPSLFERLWSEPDHERAGYVEAISLDKALIPNMRRMCRARTRRLIEDHGLCLDILSHGLLQRAVATAFQRASLKMRGVNDGTIDPQDYARMLSALRQDIGEPVAPIATSPPQKEQHVSILQLVERWWNEAQALGRKPSTYQNYRGTISGFAKFVGHNDAARMTSQDVINYKDYRLSTISEKSGRATSGKTVKDGDLAALKTVFGWAVSNRLLKENPALGITIKLTKRQKLRPKSFTDEEARAILNACLRLMPGIELPQTYAAKKWVPWLCALTGARVGEMVQLRKEDLRKHGKWWIINVTPEAGRVKTDNARDVVLHSQLVALGFPEFVESSSSGHLFVRPSKDREILGPLKGVTNRIQEFTRTTVPDKNVQPTHAWRHRFKTVGRRAGLDPYVLDVIQGHVPRTEGEKYGDSDIETIAFAIAAMPAIVLSNPAPSGRDPR